MGKAHRCEGSQGTQFSRLISTMPSDEFPKCLGDHLENGFLDHLTAASEFSLMADEATDIADQADLAIFVHYVDSNKHSITEEFLGLAEIVRSKSAEHYVRK